MQLVEQHVISQTDPRYAAIDAATFASKNLYNAANYTIRQTFIFQGVYLDYKQMHHLMKAHPAYQALPRKVSQQVLRTLDKNWQSFFKAMAEWREHPEKFLGRPSLPKYKNKQQGRNLLIYTLQALSQPALRQGYIIPSGLPIRIKTQQQNIAQVRIIPRHGFYVVEVVYEQAPVQADVDPTLFAGIDIGVNNLATLTSNKVGFVPRIVNGRPVKSINQYYNKRKTEESYTSKCSFLDKEPIQKQESYAGKRIKRGLFRASDGRLINADVNGSANIIRKVAPNAFAEGVEGVVVRPARLAV